MKVELFFHLVTEKRNDLDYGGLHLESAKYKSHW